MFYPGQKVVCIDAVSDPLWGGQLKSGLAEGDVYTIHRFDDRPPNEFDGLNEPAVFLVEIHAENPWSGIPVSFRLRRFRPLVNTDISIFTAMLNPVREDA